MEPSSDKPNPISIPPVGLVHEFTKQKKGLPGSPHPAKRNSDASRPLEEVHANRGEAIPVLPRSLSVPPVGFNEGLAECTSSSSQTGQ